MSDWKEYKISELGKVVTGKTPSSKNPEEWGTIVAFVTPTDFDSYNKSIEGSIRYLSERGANIFNSKLLPPNSVIVTCIGSQMGKVALNKIPCVTNQQINSIILNENFNSDFIYYLISSMQDYLRNLATGGSTMPIVNKSDFENIKIIAPDLLTQTAIAEILSSLDDKIELNNKINQELENLAQTLFKQWFIDFEFPNENGEPYKSSGSEMVESELGEIPKGWEVKKLSQVAIISSSKRIFSEEYVSEGIPFFRGKEITELDRSNKISSELFISEERYNQIKSKFGSPKIGDILITSVGTIGNTYLVNDDFDFYFKDGNITWIKDYISYISPYYIFTWLRIDKTQDYIKGVCIGSTQQALTISALNNLNIILPDEFLESKFALVANDIYFTISKNKNENQELTNLRDTLLPKLISGELEINENNN